MLGLEALENLEFEVAKKAFFRIGDSRSLLLVNELTVRVMSRFKSIQKTVLKQEMQSKGASTEEIKALFYAYSKRFCYWAN